MSEVPTPITGSRSCPPGSWLAVLLRGGRGLELSRGDGDGDLEVAATHGLAMVVAGEPYGFMQESGTTRAHALLSAYRQKGERFLKDLGGFFSLLVWDQQSDSLLCVRDPLGIYPLFYVRTSAGVMVSPTVETLLRQPEVSTVVNRVAVANHLRQHWPDPEETYFDNVKRVLSGHWLRVSDGSTSTARYWDPLFPGQHPAWVDEADLGHFDQLFDESVARLVPGAGAGIYLSGGLDSVSVGALAADHQRRRSGGTPLALSLAFPDPYNEEKLQASVASQLHMPQMIARLEEALGGDGVVRAAAERGALGAPVQNPWLPAYRWLAGRGAERGCRVILTGSGGDEWLTVSPMYAGDLLKGGHLIRLAALWRVHARSYNVDPRLLAKNLLWRFGAYPMLARRKDELWMKLAPDRFATRRTEGMQRSFEERPWLAPDPTLRRELRDRDEEFTRRRPDDNLVPLSGPREYFRACREALSHPLISMEAEEVYEYSRAQGVRVLHPYSDTRLVEFLHATPPELLNKGGFSKGLIRDMLKRRFPALGFERQRKLVTASFFGHSVVQQAPKVWRDWGGARALQEAGIVDSAKAGGLYDVDPARWRADGDSPDYRVTDPMWSIVTVEGWLRRH